MHFPPSTLPDFFHTWPVKDGRKEVKEVPGIGRAGRVRPLPWSEPPWCFLIPKRWLGPPDARQD